MMPSAARRAAALVVLSFAALVVVAAPAPAAPAPAVTAGCAGAVKQLKAQFAELSVGGNKGQFSDEEIQARQQEGGRLYAAALQDHPQCGDDLESLVAQLSAVARSQTAIKGTPFLGPIGWLWNNVYYRVFSGNDVMMGLFGWALLLSPIILVLSIGLGHEGRGGVLRKPHVPEHLRGRAVSRGHCWLLGHPAHGRCAPTPSFAISGEISVTAFDASKYGGSFVGSCP